MARRGQKTYDDATREAALMIARKESAAEASRQLGISVQSQGRRMTHPRNLGCFTVGGEDMDSIGEVVVVFVRLNKDGSELRPLKRFPRQFGVRILDHCKWTPTEGITCRRGSHPARSGGARGSEPRDTLRDTDAHLP